MSGRLDTNTPFSATWLKNNYLLLLAGILLVALVLRVWGLDTGLPNMSRPDEQNISRPVVQTILASFFRGEPSLNPHFFIYPSLYFYLLTTAYGVYYLIGHLTGLFPDGMAFIEHYLNDWYSFHLISRSITALFGTATVWAMVKLGNAFFESRGWGFLCGALLAVTYMHVRDSHFGVTDITATFFVTLSLWHCVKYYRHSLFKTICWAGVFGGLAAATKYPGGVVCVAVLSSYWFVQQTTGQPLGKLLSTPSQLKKILGLFVCIFGAFFLACPYILLDFQQFLYDFKDQSNTLKSVHYLNLGKAWFHHLKFSLPYGLGWLYYAAALAGIVIGLQSKNTWHKPLLIYGGVYYFLIGNNHVTFYRYLIPIVPVLILYALLSIQTLSNWLSKKFSGVSQTSWASVLFILIAAQSVWQSVWFDVVAARTDTRNLARDWILEHSPPGASVGVGLSLGHVELPSTYKKFYLSPAEGKPLEKTRLRQFIEMDKTQWAKKQNNHRNEWNINTYGNAAALRDLNVRYVMVGTSALKLYNPPQFERDKLKNSKHYKEVAQFSPVKVGDALPKPESFDELDAFYIPFHHVEQQHRPGPVITIYEVLPEGAGSS